MFPEDPSTVEYPPVYECRHWGDIGYISPSDEGPDKEENKTRTN